MKKIKILALSLIILSFTNLKAAESIMGSVEGMFCIECQKKLAKAFKDELGIIGYNKKVNFLTISSVVYTIVFNLILLFFWFHGSWSLKYLLASNKELTINSI